MRKTTPIKSRLLSKIRVDESGCWIWTGTKNGSGYGTIGIGPKTQGKTFVHRASWEIRNGTIPEGMLICHKCDVRLCVNPDHLFLGTYKDNSADMNKKGRGLAGRKRKPGDVPIGENHGHAKLTEREVIQIRNIAVRRTQSSIAEEFGVSRRLVGMIVNRRIWKHLP